MTKMHRQGTERSRFGNTFDSIKKLQRYGNELKNSSTLRLSANKAKRQTLGYVPSAERLKNLKGDALQESLNEMSLADQSKLLGEKGDPKSTVLLKSNNNKTPVLREGKLPQPSSVDDSAVKRTNEGN